MITAKLRPLLCVAGLWAAVPLIYAQQSVLGDMPWSLTNSIEPVPSFRVASALGPTTTTNDTWLGGAGNWSNAALWSTGAVPTSSNNVSHRRR